VTNLQAVEIAFDANAASRAAKAVLLALVVVVVFVIAEDDEVVLFELEVAKVMKVVVVFVAARDAGVVVLFAVEVAVVLDLGAILRLDAPAPLAAQLVTVTVLRRIQYGS